MEIFTKIFDHAEKKPKEIDTISSKFTVYIRKGIHGEPHNWTIDKEAQLSFKEYLEYLGKLVNITDHILPDNEEEKNTDKTPEKKFSSAGFI